jgi:hypothetical protein
VEATVRLLRTALAAATLPQTLPNSPALEWVYLYVGAPDRARGFNEEGAETGYQGLAAYPIWHPSYAPVRKTERFKAYLRTAGYVDYWRARGWPDLCRPVGTNDFTCD